MQRNINNNINPVQYGVVWAHTTGYYEILSDLLKNLQKVSKYKSVRLKN